MSKPIQRIAAYTFHGTAPDGSCESCGYPTDRDCLCDGILSLLRNALSSYLTHGENADYLSRANFLLEQRDFDMAAQAQETQRDDCGDGCWCCWTATS